MRLSIVIPTLNEAPRIAELLTEISPLADEVWVSDGGSDDATLHLAEAAGAQVVSGSAGRGSQLNRGAEQCKGDVLLFLHADTQLPPGAREKVLEAVAQGAIGGGFKVRFDDRRRLMCLGEKLINLRCRLTGCPLGDQAQFITRTAFDGLGGFAQWPILEDLDFARRMKKSGPTVIIQAPVRTAARRFLGQGIARTIATNWLIWGLYFVGVSPQRLACLYRQIR